MPVETTCSGCNSRLRIPDEHAGRSVRCPHCGQVFNAVPASAQAPVAPPRPAAPASVPAKPPLPPAPAVKAAPAKPTEPARKVPPGKQAASTPIPPGKTPARLAAKDSGTGPTPIPRALVKKKVEVEEVEAEEVEAEEVEAEEVQAEAVEIDDPIRRFITNNWESPLLREDPFEDQEVSDEARELVEAELSKGETIVWVGRMSPDLTLSDDRIVRVICFIILFLGLGAVVGGSVLMALVTFLPGLILLIFGVVFGGVAALGVFCKADPERARKERAIYVLTNRRCLVWESADPECMEQEFTSYSTLQVEDMKRKGSMRKPKAGDLIFAHVLVEHGGGGRHGGTSVARVPKGFLKVDGVAEVEDLVRQVLINKRIDRILS